jgi:hypothetical protein
MNRSAERSLVNSGRPVRKVQTQEALGAPQAQAGDRRATLIAALPISKLVGIR